MNNPINLSIVIPLYNEELRIVSTYPKIIDYINKVSSKLNLNFELVFVNDGSKDNTKNIINKLISSNKHIPSIVVSYPKNMGKGFALKKGFKVAKGDYILFMDADLSTPLNHIQDFINNIKDNKLQGTNTILIGSRKTKGSNVTKHQPIIRETLGKGFTLLSNLLLVKGITDFTCGFKMFPSSAGKHLFTLTKIHRWGFDSEVLFLAKKHNYNIIEVPVSWINDTNSKVKLGRDVVRSFKEVLKIRFNLYS